MLASSWLDPVLGIDIHWEMVPMPAPVPTPIPNPFIGIVMDLGGLVGGLAMSAAQTAVFGAPFNGPVLHWFLPATNTGTDAKHVPGHFIIPPGTVWAPVPRTPKPKIHPNDTPSTPSAVSPEDDAACIFGSKTVTLGGSNAVRLGDILLSCSEPVRLPSSVVLAIPKGAPILIGGPPSLDLMSALSASVKTRFISDSLHALVSRIKFGRLRNLLHKAVCFFTGHPVDVATGKVTTDAVEAELPGPLPLKIERSYSSAFASRLGPLGHGWSWSLDQAIWTEHGKVVLLEEDGRELEFDTFELPQHRLRPGEKLWHPIDRLTLHCLEHGGWRVVDAEGTTREFTPVPGRGDGRAVIRRQRSRDGFHEIAFEYDKHGRLEWVRDASGRLMWLEHDERGRVTALKLPLSRGQGFYAHRRYRYDEQGDLVEVTDALGHSWRFEYATHLLVRETNRNGLSFYFEYDGIGEDAWCTRTWGDGGIYDHKIAYDKVRKVTYVTNSLGKTTQYHMNLVGLVVKVVDPLGSETRYEYQPQTLQKTAEVDPLGQATRFQYDARGNLTAATGPDSAEVKLSYGEQNELLDAVDPCGGRWECQYDDKGRRLLLTDPRGDQTRYQYGADGKALAAIVVPGGGKTTFAYDEQGLVSRVAGPTGAFVEYQYDGLGRLVRTKDARGRMERFHYDVEGNLLRIESAAGTLQQCAYDPEGNLIEARDATRHLKLRYGHFDKLLEREEGGTHQQYRYDTEGNFIGLLNEAGEPYTFELDARGDVVAETGFDGAVRRYLRDKAGRITQQLLPSGRKSSYAYDPAGRVLSVKHPDGAETRFEYRADGALLGAQNPAASVSFERDPLGRILREAQGPFAVTSKYGADGERELMESSLGGRMAVVRDAASAPTALYCADDFARALEPTLRLERDVLGMEKARTLPGGVRIEWQRDLAGRPIARKTVRHTAGAPPSQLDHRTYLWRGEDQIAAILDSAIGPREFLHDSRGRLVAERTPQGLTHRAMDPVGNVYRSQNLSDRKYGKGGRLESASGATYAYDADGNQIEKLEPDGGRWRYHWNGAGLLNEVERPDGRRVRFEYDPFARRTRKTLLRLEGSSEAIESDTRFVWDGNALIHEVAVGTTNNSSTGATPSGMSSTSDEAAQAASSSDVTSWYFEPDSFTPVAKVSGGTKWTIASDHLGTPSEMYDELGELAWKMQFDIFGAGKPDVAMQSCPWRWPGQYEDEETGLYYNRWRYYDPTGSFISRDPLGLAAGTRLMGYPEDPLTWVDPWGLECELTYEASPKHPVGIAPRPGVSPGPLHGQAALDSSVPIGTNTTRRVGIDYADGKFVVFDETHPGRNIFHGHIRPWNGLEEKMQRALKNARMVSKKGTILPRTYEVPRT